MNADVAKKWVDALRSGDYSQGKGRLCSVTEDDDKYFCCLGVLCDLYEREHSDMYGITQVVEEKIDFDYDYDIKHEVYYNHNNLTLPQSVMEWSGIKHGDGTFTSDIEGETSLALLNDENGLTFDEIANIIERIENKL
jgi:hypothetical protein